MSQEQAAAALHAAKMAQLNALGHNFDKLPPGLLPPHLDLSKLANSQGPDMGRLQTSGGVTIEPSKVPVSFANALNERSVADIRRDDPQPMDLGLEQSQNDNRQSRRESESGNNGNSNNAGGNSSGGEDEYGSDDDGERENNS